MNTPCNTLLGRLERALLLSLLLVIGLSFCGCSTVEPELSPEERAYNEQLRQQGGNPTFYQGASWASQSATDENFGQKVVYYLLWVPQAVLYALGQSNTSFKP
jgi:hypothetical protein